MRHAPALVLGGADCVWDDLARLECMLGHEWSGMVVAANDVGAHWPRKLDFWVTLHPNKFREWSALRASLEHPGNYFRFGCPLRFDELDVCDGFIEPWPGGSSGMFAVQVALVLGSRAVLCGIPMTPTGHFPETREEFPKVWGSAEHHWRAWLRHKEKMIGRVTSMSGRTAELFGSPTVEWIRGG